MGNMLTQRSITIKPSSLSLASCACPLLHSLHTFLISLHFLIFIFPFSGISSPFLSYCQCFLSFKPCFSCLLILVDEYILMAKEKHGYNMEQVRQIKHFFSLHCFFASSLLVSPCSCALWSFRHSACYYGTNMMWSAHLLTWPISHPSQTSGLWRIKYCSSRPSASMARVFTAFSKWWETGEENMHTILVHNFQ